MRYVKNSVEYEVNWEAFHEMEELIPMTRSEHSHLHRWVKEGYDVDSNPWKYFEMDG